jgi:hypothetical protein
MPKERFAVKIYFPNRDKYRNIKGLLLFVKNLNPFVALQQIQGDGGAVELTRPLIPQSQIHLMNQRLPSVKPCQIGNETLR